MLLLRLVLLGVFALLSQPLWAHERCNPTGDGYRNTSVPAGQLDNLGFSCVYIPVPRVYRDATPFGESPPAAPATLVPVSGVAVVTPSPPALAVVPVADSVAVPVAPPAPAPAVTVTSPAVHVTGPDITVTTPDVNITNNIPATEPAQPLTVQGNLNCPVINGTGITIHGSVNCGGRRNWGFWSLNYNEDVLNAANILKYCGTALTADQARKAVENFTLIYSGWQQFDIKDNWYRQIDYLDACAGLKTPVRGFPAI